jgi:hypothetical protein
MRAARPADDQRRDAQADGAAGLDMAGGLEDAVGLQTEGARMRYKVGAEQVEHIQSLIRRPNGVVDSTRTVPAGPTHAVDAATGAVACGLKVDGLEVLDQDWEEAVFVEKCSRCLAAVLALGENKVVGDRFRGFIPRRTRKR